MGHFLWHHGEDEIDLTVTYDIEPGAAQTWASPSYGASVEIGEIYYKEGNKDFGRLFTEEISDDELESMKEYALTQ